MKKIFLSEEDKKSVGHYSPAIEHNGTIYVSGQLPLLKGQNVPASFDIEDQTQLVLEKMETILKAVGSSKDQVLRVTIYVTDLAYWPKVNAVYAKFFGDHRPARTIIPVNCLHYGCLLELEAIAFK
ncbi:MAG: RidA family protein [Asgard group archaeon]|nr:RidA family protein [Asgard group archaeon]